MLLLLLLPPLLLLACRFPAASYCLSPALLTARSPGRGSVRA
jgi:hypothetical protein